MDHWSLKIVASIVSVFISVIGSWNAFHLKAAIFVILSYIIQYVYGQIIGPSKFSMFSIFRYYICYLLYLLNRNVFFLLFIISLGWIHQLLVKNSKVSIIFNYRRYIFKPKKPKVFVVRNFWMSENFNTLMNSIFSEELKNL